jgi:short-subunit dehydrogenase
VLRCDLSRREETKRLAAEVLANGEVDILVNNAGTIK